MENEVPGSMAIKVNYNPIGYVKWQTDPNAVEEIDPLTQKVTQKGSWK